tara:strand:+ start:485 stop:784 length:300 start_codon:yes stop_codon:yes gene_type:complete
MATVINVENVEEFEQRIKDKDIIISKLIVSSILQNLIGKKKHIHILEIYIKDEDSIVDVTCHRDDFIETLEENLQIHVHHEDYESCSGIKKAIEYLKEE